MGSSESIHPLSSVPAPDRQIEDKPQRRSFAWEYKKDILDQIEAVRGERGAIGKILRREGLYASQVAAWRDEAIQRAAGDYVPPKRGRKPDPTKAYRQQIAKLERENVKLKKEVEIQKALIELQKKLSVYLDSDEEPDSRN